MRGSDERHSTLCCCSCSATYHKKKRYTYLLYASARFFFVFCFHPICYLHPSCYPPLLVVTQIRGHILITGSSSPFLLSPAPSRNSDPGSHSRLFSPLPTTMRAFHFSREKTSALSSLVDSRRITPTHARRSQQLICPSAQDIP